MFLFRSFYVTLDNLNIRICSWRRHLLTFLSHRVLLSYLCLIQSPSHPCNDVLLLLPHCVSCACLIQLIHSNVLAPSPTSSLLSCFFLPVSSTCYCHECLLPTIVSLHLSRSRVHFCLSSVIIRNVDPAASRNSDSSRPLQTAGTEVRIFCVSNARMPCASLRTREWPIAIFEEVTQKCRLDADIVA